MESTELMTTNTGIVRSVDDLARIGKMMAVSGYFQDAREAAQAAVKVQAGMEMGFGPFTSMTGIHIIQGRPSVGANLMASAVKTNPRYDYRVREMTDQACRIEFFEIIGGKRESIGVSEFTLADGKKAGTKNLDKFPRNMLFARAMSNGIRWFCPDAFNGNTVYTPEELGADVDEDGNIIEIPHVEVIQPKAEPEPVITAEKAEIAPDPAPKKDFDEEEFLRAWSKPAGVPGMSKLNAEKMTDSKGTPYGEKSTKDLFFALRAITKKIDGATDEQREALGLKVSAICEILQYRKTALTIPDAVQM
ncbi:MAG: hypothetical protein IIX93_06595 [Clostridia bacterium]|nr:hypothetical protein [Clostridia bacterium]